MTRACPLRFFDHMYPARRRSYGIVNCRTSQAHYICRTGRNTRDSRSAVVSLKFKFARNRASFGITLIGGGLRYVDSAHPRIQYIHAGHQKIPICGAFNVGRSCSSQPPSILPFASRMFTHESRRAKKSRGDLAPSRHASPPTFPL